MSELKVDYVEDVLDTTENTMRKYQIIENADGTISLRDVTKYSTVGDTFGASDINNTNSHLKATDGTDFQFATDDGRYGYMKVENGAQRFYPFSGGGANTILLGTYTANATIDVSDLDTTDVSQFIVTVPSQIVDSHTLGTHTAWGDRPITMEGTYTPPTLSLNTANGVLSVTAPTMKHGGTTTNTGATNKWFTVSLPFKVYYIGKVKFKGTVHLGRFSANTTINVANLGATSKNQFLVVAHSGSWQAFSNAGSANITSNGSYSEATWSLSGYTLTVTAPTIQGGHSCAGGAAYHNPSPVEYDVYFVGDIGERQ